ncbi:hypothetical protein JCM10207_003441 [Rhodosporidiobolus poonsookiae]
MAPSAMLVLFAALAFALLSVATPTSPSDTGSEGMTNLFGFVQRKSVVLRPSPLPSAPDAQPAAGSAPNLPSLGWDPLNFAGAAFSGSNATPDTQRRSRTGERLTWTVASGGGVEEGREALAEGDEEEEEVGEGEDDDEGGDMLGDEGWFRRRQKRGMRRLCRRSWRTPRL